MVIHKSTERAGEVVESIVRAESEGDLAQRRADQHPIMERAVSRSHVRCPVEKSTAVHKANKAELHGGAKSRRPIEGPDQTCDGRDTLGPGYTLRSGDPGRA